MCKKCKLKDIEIAVLKGDLQDCHWRNSVTRDVNREYYGHYFIHTKTGTYYSYAVRDLYEELIKYYIMVHPDQHPLEVCLGKGSTSYTPNHVSEIKKELRKFNAKNKSKKKK